MFFVCEVSCNRFMKCCTGLVRVQYLALVKALQSCLLCFCCAYYDTNSISRIIFMFISCGDSQIKVKKRIYLFIYFVSKALCFVNNCAFYSERVVLVGESGR